MSDLTTIIFKEPRKFESFLGPQDRLILERGPIRATPTDRYDPVQDLAIAIHNNRHRHLDSCRQWFDYEEKKRLHPDNPYAWKPIPNTGPDDYYKRFEAQQAELRARMALQ